MMSLEQIKKVQREYNLNNDKSNNQVQYIEGINDYLRNNPINEEIVKIIVNGMNIDSGSTFIDYVEDLTEKDLKNTWKTIKKNKALKDGGNNSVEFLALLVSQGIMAAGKICTICGEAIDLLMAVLDYSKSEHLDAEKESLITQYLIDDVVNLRSFPKWRNIIVSSEGKIYFTRMLINILDKNNNVSIVSNYRLWLKSGYEEAVVQIEKETIESNIPKSKIADLERITEHYKAVEEQLKESVYKIDELNTEIETLKKENKEKANTISLLSAKLNQSESELSAASVEIEQRKELNDSFASIKKSDTEAMLKDIGQSLKVVYRDFYASIDDTMDEMLGEIYREQIVQIFKKLKDKGIVVE